MDEYTYSGSEFTFDQEKMNSKDHEFFDKAAKATNKASKAAPLVLGAGLTAFAVKHVKEIGETATKVAGKFLVNSVKSTLFKKK